MIPQPLIAVRDVQASSLWYQAKLGFKSGHGGVEYEQLTFDRRMILQLHHWDAHAHHILVIRIQSRTAMASFSGFRPTGSTKRSSALKTTEAR
ncbi:MAG: hypothetical protein V7642_2883 [Burkholderiales bacterium]|jgi:hypothetical protein